MSTGSTASANRSRGVRDHNLALYLIYLSTLVRAVTPHDGTSQFGLIVAPLVAYGVLLILEPRLTERVSWRAWACGSQPLAPLRFYQRSKTWHHSWGRSGEVT